MLSNHSTAESHITAGEAAPASRVVIVFAALMLAVFLAALGQTIVATALPAIVGGLHGLTHMPWVVTAYLLTATIGLPIYGKLGGLLGRKWLFAAAIVIFLAGSVLSGLSRNMDQLIVFRALQGAGAGGLLAGAQAIIGDIIPPRQRGRYLGVAGAVSGVATVAGPLLGGYLTDAVSWRWVFFVNVPAGIVALAIVIPALRLPARARGARLDLAGMTVMPLRLFRSSTFCVAGLIGFVAGVTMFGAVVYLPTFLQMADHASATTSGLLMLPFVGGVVAASIASGRIVTATGRYRACLIAGTAIATAGLVLLSRMSPTSTQVENGAALAVLGIGIGLVTQPLVLVAQSAAAHRDLGAATAAASYFRLIGGSLGSALIGSLFVSRLTSRISALAPPGARTHLPSVQALTPQGLASLPAGVRGIVVRAYAQALPPVFLYLVPVMAAGFLLSFFLRERRLRATLGPEPSATVPAEGEAEADAVPAGGGDGWAAAGNGAGRAAGGAGHQARGAGRAGGGEGPADPAAGPAGAREGPGSPLGVYGRVRRADGSPAAGATVTLIDAGGRQAGWERTGPDGAYRVPVPGPGSYTLIVMAGGHEPQACAACVGDRPAHREVTLAGGGGLTGTVRAAGTGTPLAGATVTLLRTRGEVVAARVTGPDGSYRFESAAPGRYTLAVSAPSCQPAAIPLVIGPAAAVTQDAELAPYARLAGTARTAAGTAVPDARIMLLDRDGNALAATVTGTDGRFSFGGLPRGEYTVIASGYPPVASKLTIASGAPHYQEMRLGHPEA